MLTRLSLPSISNWKPSFTFSFSISNPMLFSKDNEIHSMISANLSGTNQRFQRFFSQKLGQKEMAPDSSNIEQLEQLASNGDANAAYQLTQIYKNKSSTQEKFEKYLKQAAILGHPTSMYEYGLKTILKQIKTQNDPNLADKCIKLVIQEGKPQYLYSAALYYYENQKQEECEKCLKMAIEKGNTYAMTLYGHLLINTNPEESIRYLRMAINNKDPLAMYIYALCIIDDHFTSYKGEKIDNRDGFKYIKMAADSNGIKDAIIQCARMLLEGDLCEKNIKKSMFYYKKAADFHNDADSQYIYGYTLYNGYDDVKPNQKVGALYMKKAAYQNHPIAAYQTALIFRNGKGLFKVPERSYQFFKASADAGYITAIKVCAYSFFTGKFPDFEKDFTFAANYIQNGAQLNDSTCIYNLGLIYMSGEGIKKNYEKGKYYLELAD